MPARLCSLDTNTGAMRLYHRPRPGAPIECIGRTRFVGWEQVACGIQRLDTMYAMTVIANFRNFPSQFCDPEPDSPSVA